MRVTEHDPDRPPPTRPVPDRLTFTPFRTLRLDPHRELRIDIAEGPKTRSISARLFQSKGRGRSMEPGRPLHLFAEHLPSVIAALTEAAAALAVPTPETE